MALNESAPVREAAMSQAGLAVLDDDHAENAEPPNVLWKKPGEGGTVPSEDGAVGPSRKSTFTAYIFTVNFILGSGVLAIPYAIQQAGIALGLIFLVVITFLAFVTMSWLVELQSRIRTLKMAYDEGYITYISVEPEGVVDDDAEDSHLLDRNRGRAVSVTSKGTTKFATLFGGKGTLQNTGKPRTHAPYELGDLSSAPRLWELRDMCRVFLGSLWGKVYSACVLIQLVCCMWLYIAVWAGSLMVVIPVSGWTTSLTCDMKDSSGSCGSAYRVFVAVCFAVVGGLSCKDWQAMGTIQTSCTILAYCCLILMVATVLSAVHKPYAEVEPSPAGSEITWFEIGNFGYAFTSLIWSQLCHMGCPAVMRVMPKPSKAKPIFAAAFSTTAVVYAAVSVPSALYFRDSIEQIVTMNWKNYTAGHTDNTPPYAKLVTYIVLLFPVFTITAALILYTKTLGATVEGAVPLNWKMSYSRFFGAEYHASEDWPEVGPVRFTSRLLALGIPTIGAFAANKVLLVVNLAGIFGFFIMFFYPLFLQVKSIQLLNSLDLPSFTPYSSRIISLLPAQLVVGAAAAGGFGYFCYLLH